jgi:hypothetical protein
MRPVHNLILLIVILVSSCQRQEPRYNEISSVELATGDCFGPCQYTATRIDSSLQFNFLGGPLSPGRTRKTVRGNYTGRISRSFWDSLNKKLEHIHYKLLDTSYQQSADDQSLELIVYYHNKIKHVKAQSASLPDSVREVFDWIANSHKSVKLEPGTRLFQYHTKVQIPFKIPFSLDGVDFSLPK